MMFLKSGDLDLDGEIDLVYTEWIFGSNIAYGEGAGVFENPVQIPVPSMASITLDYVNSDTLLDIIAISGSDGRIYILENNGNRSFSANSWPHPSTSLNFVATGYFNDDAYLDFVASPAMVYFGDGTGAFPLSSSLPIDTAYGADMSDFNKDGHDDMVLVGTDSSWILLNDGDGNFSLTSSLYLGTLAISVSSGNALADFNNDGNPDFALMAPTASGEMCSGSLRTEGLVVLGDGSGGILDTTKFEVCGTTYNLVSADVNQDLELDLIAANGSKRRLEMMLGNGDGTFQPPDSVSLNTNKITYVLANADLDKDGNPDFVSGGGLVDADSIICALNNLPDKQILIDEMVTTGFTSVDFEVQNPDGFKISRLKSSVAGSRFDRLDKNTDGALDAQSFDYNLQYGEYTLIFRKKPDITSPTTFDANVRIGDSKLLRIFDDYETPGTARGSVPNDSIIFHIDIEQYPSIVPISGATEYDDMPYFRWNGLFADKNNSANTYEFQLDSKIDFSGPILNETGLANRNFTLGSPLSRDAIYYWRVRSFDGVNYSPWSNEFAVYIGPFFCGDVNNDGNGSNILDLTFLVDFIFRGGPPAPIAQNADLNGDGNPGNILDLTALVDYKHRQMQQFSCGT